MRRRIQLAASSVLTILLTLCLCGTFWAGEAILADQADLLSAREEEELKETAADIVKEYNYDIMLVTTRDAGGRSAMEYAEDFFMEHHTTLDGTAYLIDMDNREIYVATSGDMRFWLDDARIEKILDDAYDCVSQEQYAGGFRAMLQDTDRFLKQGLTGAYTYDTQTGEVVRYQKPRSITLTEFLVALAAGLLTFGGIFGSVLGKYRLKIGKYKYSFRENSQVRLNQKEDRFVNRIVTHRHIPKPSSSSSNGSSGSGSSVHTGSGGNSFGGGGRKF